MHNLTELLEKFPQIKLASQEDNTKILNFYQKSHMKSNNSDVIYERSPDYFSFLKERSPHYLVFLIIIDNKIKGLCSFNYRNCSTKGNSHSVGYVADLRVRPSFKATKIWRLFADDFFKYSHKFKETLYCHNYYTVLMNTNQLSTNNFLNKGIKNLRFTKLYDYNMINYLGNFNPFAKDKSLSITNGLNSESIDLFKSSQQSLDFGYEPDEIHRRFKDWKNFSEKNILNIYEHDKLIATTSIWSPHESKRIRHFEANSLKNFMFQVLRILSPFNIPKNAQVIDIIYLNQIHFTNKLPQQKKQQVLRTLLKYVKCNHPCHIVSYCDFKKLSLHQGLKKSFILKMDMAFYEISHIDSEDKSKPSFNKLPAFEMSLV